MAFSFNIDPLGAISSIFGLAYDINKDQHLTGAQREANAFSADQAQIARQWQEDQYLKYNSPKAMVQQYTEAGLNPALMYEGASGSSASMNTSAPSSVAPSNIGSMLQNMMQLATLNSQKRLIDAQASNLESKTRGQDIENDFKPDLFRNELRSGEISRQNMLAGIAKINKEIENLSIEGDLKSASIDQIKQSISESRSKQVLIGEQVATEVARRSLMSLQGLVSRAQAQNISLDSVYKQFSNDFREQFGTSPDQPAMNALVGMLGKASNQVADSLVSVGRRLLGFFKN